MVKIVPIGFLYVFCNIFVHRTHPTDLKPRWNFCSRNWKNHIHVTGNLMKRMYSQCSKIWGNGTLQPENIIMALLMMLFGTELTAVGFKEGGGRRAWSWTQPGFPLVKNRGRGNLGPTMHGQKIRGNWLLRNAEWNSRLDPTHGPVLLATAGVNRQSSSETQALVKAAQIKFLFEASEDTQWMEAEAKGWD